jgi:hypothetical protein
MTATARRLDFRPRYDGDELDRLARKVAEVLAPVFETNGWRWEGEIPSVVDLAFAIRRLLEMTAQSQDGKANIQSPIWVNRNPEDDGLRVYLEVDVAWPTPDES